MEQKFNKDVEIGVILKCLIQIPGKSDRGQFWFHLLGRCQKVTLIVALSLIIRLRGWRKYNSDDGKAASEYQIGDHFSFQRGKRLHLWFDSGLSSIKIAHWYAKFCIHFVSVRKERAIQIPVFRSSMCPVLGFINLNCALICLTLDAFCFRQERKGDTDSCVSV